jgi:hypothetical protein
MTDTLKTVLVNALKESSENPSTVIDHWTEDGETTLCIDHVGRNECHFDLDRLVSAIRDHYATVLSNIHGEAIQAALVEALLADKVVTVDGRGRLFQGDRELKTDQMAHVFADRLIEGLTL